MRINEKQQIIFEEKLTFLLQHFTITTIKLSLLIFTLLKIFNRLIMRRQRKLTKVFLGVCLMIKFLIIKAIAKNNFLLNSEPKVFSRIIFKFIF